MVIIVASIAKVDPRIIRFKDRIRDEALPLSIVLQRVTLEIRIKLTERSFELSELRPGKTVVESGESEC